MKRMFSLLIALVVLFSSTAAYAAVPGISNNTNKSTPSSNTGGFTIKPIDWDTAVLGQYVLPDGYSANRMIYNCDDNSTLGYPIRVSVVVSSNADDARMMYYCGSDYLDRVQSNAYMPHKEGQVDKETMTMMRHYQNADQYCDALAQEWVPNAVFYKSEDVSACDARLQAKTDKIWNETVPGMKTYGMNTNWVEGTAAERVYTYQNGNKKYCICVMAEVYALQYTTKAAGFTLTSTIWEVPNYYILWCPYDSYERIHDGVFSVFVENTSVNDELLALNEKLNQDISDKVRREMNMQCAASMSYMATMTALTFSMVESNMSYSYTGSYSSDRFSDYMFDQNDYTLSDGSSVKVPTSYNYVWEGSNGTVYYGNSLSDAPGGATQLYANH